MITKTIKMSCKNLLLKISCLLLTPTKTKKWSGKAHISFTFILWRHKKGICYTPC